MESTFILIRRCVLLVPIVLVFSVVLLNLPAAHSQPSGRINGASFISLDGSPGDYNGSPVDYQGWQAEQFGWVINNIGSPDVESKLRNTFAAYQQADINWVRILIDPTWFNDFKYPAVPKTRIQNVNAFMSIAADFGITTEIVFTTLRDPDNGSVMRELPPTLTIKLGSPHGWTRQMVLTGPTWGWFRSLEMQHLGITTLARIATCSMVTQQ
jgi:hypothetical protein